MQNFLIFTLFLILSACTNNSDKTVVNNENQRLITQGDGNFGVVEYGTNKIKSFVFTNNTDIAVSGNPQINGNGFEVALQLGCNLIEPGKNCLVKVIFKTYNKESGDYQSSLILGGQTINLSASILSVPLTSYQFIVNNSIIDSNLDIGELPGLGLKLMTFRIKNNSPKIGQASSLVFSNSKFKILNNQCLNIQLKPGQSCMAKVVVQGNNTSDQIDSDLSFDNQTKSVSVQQSVQDLSGEMLAVNDSIVLGDFFQEGVNKIQLIK